MDKERLIFLVEQAQAGNDQVWDELLGQIYPWVARQCAVMISAPDDREDAIQETMLTIYRKLNLLKEPITLRHWVTTVTTNRCINYLRSKGKYDAEVSFVEDEDGRSMMEQVEDEDRQVLPEEVTITKETAQAVYEMVNSLPEGQRMVVLLHYYNEMSVAQIASALSIPVGTVKSRLSLARKNMKTRTEEYEKKGIQLFGIAPLPMLGYILRMAESEISVEAARACVSKVLATGSASAAGVSAGTAVGGTSAAAGSTAAATGTATAAGTTAAAGIFAGATGKIVAGVAAAIVALGGIGAVVANTGSSDTPATLPTSSQSQPTSSQSQPTSSEVVISEEEPEQLSEDELLAIQQEAAYTAYEQLLISGYDAESDIEINYYTCMDINGDDIPELIIADNDGTMNTWTEFSVYTYENDELRLCGATNSRYEPITYVNSEYVVGIHRLGAQYIGVDNNISTYSREDYEVYATDGSVNSDAEEVYRHYNAFDTLTLTPGGFVETIEEITLRRNDVCEGELVARHMGTNELIWSFSEDGTLTISGTGYMDDYYFDSSTGEWDAPWAAHSRNITTVIMEEGVLSIGSHAFTQCTSLVHVVLPDSLMRIGDEAFNACTHLQTLNIPANVSRFGLGVFLNCYTLSSLSVAPENPYLCVIDDVLYTKDLTELIVRCPASDVKELIIPDGVTRIHPYACFGYTGSFDNSNALTKVTIPASVTNIGLGAFASCPSLTDVYYGGSPAEWEELNSSFDILSGTSKVQIHYGAIFE